MVGAQASERLKVAVGALIANEGATLVSSADGRIISNNSGSQRAEGSSTLISDQGGAARGAGLVSNHGAGRRLTQLEAEQAAISDPRMALWFYLCMVDLVDQHLLAWQKAGPHLGRWLRFQTPELKLLPTPTGSEALAPFLDQVEQAFRAQHLAALVTSDAEALRLRMVVVDPNQAPSAGTKFLDLASPTAGDPVLFLDLPPPLAQALGVAKAREKMTLTQGGLTIDSGEDYLPWKDRNPLAQLLGGQGQVMWQIRRQVTIHKKNPTRATMEENMAALYGLAERPDQGLQSLRAFGFHPSLELGLATFNRSRGGPVASLAQLPFSWSYQSELDPLPELPVLGAYLHPDGRWNPQPSEELKALMPSFSPQAVKQLFPVPDGASSTSAAMELQATAWPASVWALPFDE